MGYECIGKGYFQHRTVEPLCIEVIDNGAAKPPYQTVFLDNNKMGCF